MDARRKMDGKISEMIDDVSEGIRVLRDRDGVMLTDEQISERARNIVAGLIGNYAFTLHPSDA